jgi:hypothetical protein
MTSRTSVCGAEVINLHFDNISALSEGEQGPAFQKRFSVGFMPCARSIGCEMRADLRVKSTMWWSFVRHGRQLGIQLPDDVEMLLRLQEWFIDD